MPVLLELFSGSGSVGEAFRRQGWEVVSVDCDGKCHASHTVDILDFDYTNLYEKGTFSHIHASPPCTEYSIAKTIGKRDFEKADKIVERTLEIMAYYECGYTLENPWTGYLKTRPCMMHLPPPRVVSYCKYGMPYRKNTAFWDTLGDLWQPPPRCSKFSRCDGLQEGRTRHPCVAQQRPGTDADPSRTTDPRYSTRQLYVIPRALCDEIAAAATAKMRSSVE